MSTVQVNRVVDASGGVLAPISSVMRNRIINGAMVIDQRNAGTSVTNPGDVTVYLVDRWNQRENTAAELTFQQVADAPAGFVNSLKVTVTTADSSIAATDYSVVRQSIEGYNTSDLAWGTVNAAPITMSFWVKSSVTGTYGGAFTNSATDRCMVFSYTINTANTWEQKTITVAGDTTGTWLTNNDIGIRVIFGLTVGSTFSKAAGVWNSTNAFSVTGNTALISTVNATWFVTGVQLEKGTQATSFEYRQYGQELALCQRYFESFNVRPRFGMDGATGTQRGTGYFKVTKRATPTITGTVYSTITDTTTDGFSLSRVNNPTDADSPLGISAEL